MNAIAYVTSMAAIHAAGTAFSALTAAYLLSDKSRSGRLARAALACHHAVVRAYIRRMDRR